MPTTSFQPEEEDNSVNLLDATDLKGKSVRSVEVFGEQTSVTTWAEALDTIAEAIYNRNPEFIEKVADDEWLSRFFKQDPNAFYNSAEILDTGYFIDTGNDTNTKLRIVSAFGKIFNLASDEVKAELTAEKKSDDDEEDA